MYFNQKSINYLWFEYAYFTNIYNRKVATDKNYKYPNNNLNINKKKYVCQI